MKLRLAVLTLVTLAAAQAYAAQITVRTQNYINFPDTIESQTVTLSYQLFTGSTDCSSGGGAVTSVTGVNSGAGFTFDTGAATSFQIIADPAHAFPRSEQNGPFVSWGWDNTLGATVLTPGAGQSACVSGFGDMTFFARLYVGIQTFDACGAPKTTFAPGETMQIRFAGGIIFSSEEPQRVLIAGGSVNECTFFPTPPSFTTLHITSDPQTLLFTLPSSDADILPGCVPGGTQHITGNWRVVAYDSACGCNRNQANFIVDSAATPSSCPITCPSDIVVSNDPGACGANVTYTAPSGPGTVTCDHISGSLFPVGTTTVTCTSSLGSSCNFHVTVNDTVSPIVTAPANVTASAGPSCTPVAVSTGTATATDNCGIASITATRSDAQPLAAPFPVGVTTITWTATDTHGNTASASQTVTVTPPPFVFEDAEASPSSLWPPNHDLVSVKIETETHGGCGTPACAVTSISSNQPVTGPGDNTTPDWVIVDAHHVKLRAERTGGKTRIYTITITCHDGSGQTATHTVKVKVAHDGEDDDHGGD